ncbi:hypothetical protein D3C72_1222620 [compost metagenome]
MKLFVGLFALLISMQAFAGDPNLANATSQNGTEGGDIATCEDGCLDRKGTNQVFQMRDLRTVVNDNVIPKAIAKAASATKYTNGGGRPGWADSCGGFATSKGFGPWGKHLNQILDPQNQPFLFKGTEDLLNVCPNWDDLSTQAKKGIIILAIGSAAQMESTCNPQAKNEAATYGTAYGLMQLHLGEEDQKIGDCRRGDARDPLKSLTCTVTILEEQLSRERAYLTRESHFGVFFPNAKGRAIMSAIKKFPGCH